MTYVPALTQYVTPLTLTVAQLHISFPPAIGYLGKYARVSDLYGSVDDIMRCRWDGVAYKWVPQRESFNGTSNVTGGTVNILPLITPPTLKLVGTLISAMTITPLTTYAYIGQRQRVIQSGSVGALLTTITGLIGSNLTLLSGGSKDIEYGPTGWFASS